MIELIFILVFNVLEAFHDDALIKSQDHNAETKYTKRWHIFSALLYASIIVYMVILGVSWMIIPLSLIARRVVFDVPLNLLLGKKWNYLSDNGVDKIMKKLGPSAKLIEIGVFVASLIIYLVINK
jgi:hypothetical protein